MIPYILIAVLLVALMIVGLLLWNSKGAMREALGAIEEQEILIDDLKFDLGQARRRGSRKAGIIDRARRA